MSGEVPTRGELEVGMELTWICTPRGGYGFSYPVNARVLGFGRCRVKIEVERKDGTKVARYVDRENLRWRRPPS